MKHCPKCGSWSVVGPRYHVNEYGHERLNYRCANCGYEQSEPTVDAQRAEEARRQLAEKKP